MTSVRYKDVAFVGTPKEYRAPMGMSISEIVANVPDLPNPWAGDVKVNGVIIPHEFWSFVRPKSDNTVVVTLHPPTLHGGGSGSTGKQIFQLVAVIALFVASAGVAGGALATLGGAFAAGEAGALIAAGAISVGGSLALRALSPPPSLPAITGQSQQGSVSSLNQASLQGNVLQPGQSVPCVIGTHRVFPPLAGRPVVEIVGENEVVEGAFILAGGHKLEQIRVGDVPIDQLVDTGFKYEVIDGRNLANEQLTLIRRQGYTDTPNVELSSHSVKTEETAARVLTDTMVPRNSTPKWSQFVSRQSPDEIWTDLLWDQGMISQSDAEAAIAMAVRMRIRLRGTTDWINLPEMHFRNAGMKYFRKSIRLMFRAQTDLPAPRFGDQPFAAYWFVPTQSIEPIGLGGWTAHSSFYDGVGPINMTPTNYLTSGVINTAIYSDRVEFYLPNFPKGMYEIEIIKGYPYNLSLFNFPSYEVSNGDEGINVYDFFGYHILEATTPGIAVDLSKITHSVRLIRLTSIWNEPLIKSQDFAIIAIKGTGRQLDGISVLASRYVNDWDGTGWNNLTTTSNPAPHIRDILTGWLNIDPLHPRTLNNAELLAFRQHCIDFNYTADAVMDGLTVEEAANLIAGCGRGRLRRAEKWGVLFDKDRSLETPIQIFSAMNLANFSFSKGFGQLPCGFRVRFNDITNDYKEKEVIVLDPRAPMDTGLYEDMPYTGLVYEDKAISRALYDLAVLRYRPMIYNADVDLEGLMVTGRGDLVGVNHDILMKRTGTSRVVQKIIDEDGKVEGLQLMAAIFTDIDDAWTKTEEAWTDYADAWTTPGYGVTIRLVGGAGETTRPIQLVSGDGKTIKFVIPFEDPDDAIDFDCLVVSGPLGKTYQRCYVHSIVPSDTYVGKITFVDEAPEIWS